jgi:cytochrome P450
MEEWGAYDRDDPYPLLARVREHTPVTRVRLVDGHHAWLITGFEEAKVALNHPGLSKDMLAAGGSVVAEGLPGPDFARHLLNVDPPDHTRLRKLVGAAFSNAAMAALRPRVEAVVEELIARMADLGPEAVVDLKAAFAFPLPITIIGEMLGIPVGDRVPLGEWFDRLLSPRSDDPVAEATAASESIVAFLRRLVAAKRECRGEDLVSALVAACDDRGELDERELLSMLLIMIVAGHDTTASALLNAVVALLRHPAQLERLRADPGLIPACIEEVLRSDGPGLHATFRYTTTDVAIGGVTIPSGEQVLVCLAAANRDGARFPDGEKFDIARPDNRHLGFGHGIHFCLGAPLARMELQTALAALIARFAAMRLAVPESDLHWSHGDGIVLRGLESLPVVMGQRTDTGPAPAVAD